MKRLLNVKAWSGVCTLALLALLLPSLASAQSQATTAEINGRVTDSQSGVLPGVTVTARNTATGYSRTIVTNEEGVYLLSLLPPGSYELDFELAGFSTVKRTVPLTVGAVSTVNATMNVGVIQENVTVQAAVPVVETSSTIRSTTLNQDAIANLPINGRRFQDFITLTPTVQVDTSRGQLSFAGQRGINSNVSIDGADYNQPFFGGIRGGERSNNAFTIPQESIKEFQVVAAGYSAEFGRSTGGLVNAITKSGSNTSHGSGFYVNRHRDLAEKNAFGQTAAPTQQQFGGSVGGPIIENRLFYFGALELQRFKNTRNVVFNFSGVTPGADNLEAYNYFKGLEEPFDTTNNAVALLGRVDYQAATGTRITARYNWSDNKALNANATGNALSDTTVSAVSNNGTERDRTNTVLGELTSVLKNNLLFEARGQYARERRPRDANARQPLVTGTVGNVGTVSFLGDNIQRDVRSQASSNFTGLFGAHSFKGGFEYNHVFATQLFGFDQFSTYAISGTSSAMLEALTVGGPNPNRLDVPVNVASMRKQLGNLTTELTTDELAFYAQDAWRLTSTFTLNYGVRWEGAFNPTPQADNQAILSQLRGVTFPLGKSVDPTQIPDQLDQWAPRLGFAWDPAANGKTVVRGYTGIYYARTPMLIYSDPMTGFRTTPGNLTTSLPFTNLPAGNPNTTLYRQLLLIGIDLNTISLSQLPAITQAQIQQIAAALGLSPNPFLNANVIAVDKDFKNPRAKQLGFGFERELAPRLVAGADFTYVKTDRLERNVDLNLSTPVPAAGDPALRPVYPTARPVSGLGQVQIRESSARSDYKALSLTSKFDRRWGQLSASYVLSKSMSDDDNERDSGGVGYENGFNLDPEWSPARLDRRHQFNGYALFFLPHGFDVSSGYRFLSGLPIDASFGRDINNSRGGPDRPFSGPGVPFERNAFRNEPFKEVNFRAQWGLNLMNGRRVKVTAEVFNLFNFENIQLSGTAVTNYCAGTAPLDCGFSAPTNPNFLALKDSVTGQLIQTNIPGAPRQVQLGVRYEF
ncbi:MAG TPA: carboxypeptidase regulatory-like domain-containing protein [Vicinamibacterales bacterium]